MHSIKPRLRTSSHASWFELMNINVGKITFSGSDEFLPALKYIFVISIVGNLSGQNRESRSYATQRYPIFSFPQYIRTKKTGQLFAPSVSLKYNLNEKCEGMEPVKASPQKPAPDNSADTKIMPFSQNQPCRFPRVFRGSALPPGQPLEIIRRRFLYVLRMHHFKRYVLVG